MRKIAMIFSAGLGTRLWPITDNLPKALAPVASTTLLGNAINYLKRFGFQDFVINTHHFAERINNYLQSIDFQVYSLEISFEGELLDTAGGLAYASRFFKADDLILLYNVDIVTNIDLQSYIDYHIKSDADVSLLTQDRKTSRYFLFDESSELVGWTNESTGEKILKESFGFDYKKLAFNGLHIVDYSILKMIKPDVKKSLTPFYLENMNHLKIKSFEISSDAVWFDCGKPETLKRASDFLEFIG